VKNDRVFFFTEGASAVICQTNGVALELEFRVENNGKT
jgi:hypothetical protein